MSKERDVDFLYEIGMLRHLPRQWQRFGGIGFANLADHHFRVMWIALIIAGHEKGVDTEKIVKMAMVHDIAESRTNDVDYISRQYTERNEAMALDDMLEDTVVAEEFLTLVHEYEERKSLEAKIVKDADNLDVDMELHEQRANGADIPGWVEMRQQVADNHLFTQTARDLHAQLKTTNPHHWHTSAKRNRINGGDWKKNKK